jgi:hypothetical protein
VEHTRRSKVSQTTRNYRTLLTGVLYAVTIAVVLAVVSKLY